MISLIVALASNRVIGINGKLPWHIPSDLKRFKQLTENNIVVMGRKTFESLPFENGLPNRMNVVITSNPPENDESDVLYYDFVDESLLRDMCEVTGKDVFVIGGASMYEQCFPFVDKAHLSIINSCIDGDTYFPDVDWYEWEKISDEDFPEYTYRVMERIKKEIV